MSISSSDTDSIGLSKLQLTSKAVQEESSIDDAHPKAYKTLSIIDLPDDCLSLVYKSLKSGTDHSSFGLVCHHWLQIQNDNHESLWDIRDKCCLRVPPNISAENFSKIVCKLLIRFQHLKRLSLSGLPEVTDYIAPQSQFFGSEVQFVCLRCYSGQSDKKLSLIFSAFPRLTSVLLSSSTITDTGLEVLAKCCASLEKVNLGHCYKITDKGLEILAKSCSSLMKVDLSGCQRITDSGICFVVQNCSKIRSLKIPYCSNVTGIGFSGCPKTLIEVDATDASKLTTAGIKSIASGGGIKYLDLSGNAVNNEAVITISKCCPLLESLCLESCPNVQLEGWKAIGLYCRNLTELYLENCPKLCVQGLKALCYGCNKLSRLWVDRLLSRFALDLFKRERPEVHLYES